MVDIFKILVCLTAQSLEQHLQWASLTMFLLNIFLPFHTASCPGPVTTQLLHPFLIIFLSLCSTVSCYQISKVLRICKLNNTLWIEQLSTAYYDWLWSYENILFDLRSERLNINRVYRLFQKSKCVCVCVFCRISSFLWQSARCIYIALLPPGKTGCKLLNYTLANLTHFCDGGSSPNQICTLNISIHEFEMLKKGCVNASQCPI